MNASIEITKIICRASLTPAAAPIPVGICVVVVVGIEIPVAGATVEVGAGGITTI